MADILTRTYTYAGTPNWTAGVSSVPLSSFAVSGDTRPITQILSIEVRYHRYHDTSSTVVHTAELVFGNGAASLISNQVSKRGDGGIFQIDTTFPTMPSAANFNAGNVTLRTNISTKQDQVYWRATAAQPMTLIITYYSSEFKPSISAAKLYRANSLGAASDEGTCLTFTAKLAVASAGTGGSGALRLYAGETPQGTNALVYSQSGIAGSTAGVTVTKAPIPNYTIARGEKRWFRLEFSYTATTSSGAQSTELTSVMFWVGNVFTNVHLAGASTGGARLGGYSTATENNPKFECDYPVYLYGGIAQIGDGSGDVLTMLGIQRGSSAEQSVANSRTATVTVTFPKPYAAAPVVVANIVSTSTSYYLGRCNVAIQNVSATGFTALIANGGSSPVSFGFSWVAFGKLAE